MVYVQWQKGEAGVPTKQIIWPEGAATKAAITR